MSRNLDESRLEFQAESTRPWHNICLLRFMPRARLAVVALLAMIGFSAQRVVAEDRTEGTRVLQELSKALGKSSNRADRSEIAGQANHATWEVLTGEIASIPELTMYTGAIDALEAGLQEIDQLSKSLASDPTLTGTLAKTSPPIVMRLDAVQVRQEQIRKRLDQARTQERERLSQLRRLAQAYVAANKALTISNGHFLVGDMVAADSDYQEVLGRLEEVKKILESRRDYYLFSDEPVLGSPMDSELKLITKMPEPFSRDILSHLAALQCLVDYRLAIAGSKGTDTVALQKVVEKAKAVLAAGDPRNPVALFALAGAHRQLGLAATASDPAAHKTHGQARPHFEAALSALRQIEAVSRNRAEDLRGIGAEVATWTGELASPDGFLERSNELTAAGRLNEAHAELGRGLRLHRVPALLLARADAARRMGSGFDEARTEFEKGRLDGLLSSEDPSALLTGVKLGLAACWQKVSTSLEQMSALERKQLSGQIGTVQRDLDQAEKIELKKPGKLMPQIGAYKAAAVVLRAMVDPDAGRDPTEEEAALSRASNSIATLKSSLSEAKGIQEVLDLREALIAGRLAQGNLALRILPDYRDDAALAFASAADEQAKLPYGKSNAKMTIGSPVISAILNRSEGHALLMAHEERSLRKMVSLFLEGSFTQSLGNAREASRQMASALKEASGNLIGEQNQPRPLLDAGKLLDQSDSADAKLTTMRSLRCFSVLTFADAGFTERAVIEAVRTALGDVLPATEDGSATTPIPPDLLSRAIGSATDPLVAYSLAQAIEAHAQTLTDPNTAAAWLHLAKEGQGRAHDLFDKAPNLRARFPEIAQRNSRSIARLVNPSSDVARARELRLTNRCAEAVSLLKGTINRHPHSLDARVELALGQRDLVRLGETEPSTTPAILASIEPYQGKGCPKLDLLVAELHEQLHKDEQALRDYRRALAQPLSAEERVQANSRIAVLSARVERY